MASVFTFDPDPPRVASPWSLSAQRSPRLSDEAKAARRSREALIEDFEELNLSPPEDLHVTRLGAEPQEGPTEYKLHLLLRPRRSFLTSSTTKHIAGSQASRQGTPSPRLYPEGDRSAPMSHSYGSRQYRLEQLTTQLLWRLQQSSPHHTSSANNVILPKLLDATQTLLPPTEPGKLVPGLEESKGALYEIGVSDDGTFVGLAKDEMIESLNNLRAMAFSIGCSVEILRMVPVGECCWIDEGDAKKEKFVQSGRLYVAEAYVKPELRVGDSHAPDARAKNVRKEISRSRIEPTADHVSTEQLRVSITGATTSGKSTLLGTLSTSAVDNGRGSSRLSLLKHRHEIASGITSSLAQELIGYKDVQGANKVDVLNYGSEDVVSWNDIHAEANRLTLLTDSAGHPRFRRTTVRGLVGWAPHWTMLCVAANGGTDGDLASVVSDPSFSGASAHLSMAHLDLCLRLDLPLVVIVTKLDVANKTTLTQILSALLSMVKAAGRKPVLLRNDNRKVTDQDLHAIREEDGIEIEKLCATLHDAPRQIVPVLFTSSVSGQGIGKLHALLKHLPIVTSSSEADRLISGRVPVFHIDDTYTLPASAATAVEDTNSVVAKGFIASGYLAKRSISIGDELLVGPFSFTSAAQSSHTNPPPSNYDDAFLTPRSFGEALIEATSSPKLRVLPREREWRRMKVISVRNLRLPVITLQEDQAGTIGLVAVGSDEQEELPEIRKGMVATGGDPQGTHTFTATFDSIEATLATIGNTVVVYCASMREPAKIIAVALGPRRSHEGRGQEESKEGEDSDPFAFEMDSEATEEEGNQYGQSVQLTLQFISYRAWLEVGASVLIMPTSGGGSIAGAEVSLKSFTGFDGYVGRVAETFG